MAPTLGHSPHHQPIAAGLAGENVTAPSESLSVPQVLKNKQNFTRTKIRNEAVIMFAVSLVILLITVTLIVNSTLQKEENDRWVTHTHLVIEQLEQLISHVKDAETGQRGYLITNEKTYLQPYTSAKQDLARDIRNLRALTRDNQQQQLNIEHLEQSLKNRMLLLNQAILIQDRQGQNKALELIRTGEGHNAMVALRNVIETMVANEHHLLSIRSKSVQESSEQLRSLSILGFLVILLLLGSAFYLINREMGDRQTAQDSLQTLNDRLEQTVAERTHALKEQLEYTESITSNLLEGVYRIDQKGIVTFMNPAAECLLGYKRGELLGQSIHAAIHYKKADGSDYPETECLLAPVLQFGQLIQSTEDILTRKDGSQFPILCTSAPLKDNGQIIGAVMSFHDITERKQAERELEGRAEEVRKLNQELELRVEERTAQLMATNKELEAFSYSVSHDLRSPLRSIDGFSQALLEDYEDQLDSVGQDFLKRVRMESQRMGRLIDDMLNLSRLTRGEMRKENVNLSDMAEEILTVLRQQDPRRTITSEIAPNLTDQADERLIYAVLQNLLGNAWKFTSLHPTAYIQFGMETNEMGKPVYFVRDDGAGFDMSYVDKLFGAFQRLHAMSEFTGTGIGLATVQRIIHRHDGRVWAESAVEQGATFYFTLS